MDRAMAKVAEAAQQKWQQEAFQGDALKDLLVSPHWKTFDDLILKEIEVEAFMALKRKDFDIEDKNQLLQLRAACMAVDGIRRKIELKIHNGTAARENLLSYSNPDNEESENA